MPSIADIMLMILWVFLLTLASLFAIFAFSAWIVKYFDRDK